MIIDAETVTKCIHTKLTIQWSVLVSPCTDTMLSIASCQAQLRDNLKESRDSMPAAETQSRRVNQSPRLLIIQRWRLRCCRGERPRPSRVDVPLRAGLPLHHARAHCGAPTPIAPIPPSHEPRSLHTHTHTHTTSTMFKKEYALPQTPQTHPTPTNTPP